MTGAATFEDLLQSLRQQGFWLGELAGHCPTPDYTPRAAFRVVLYHTSTSTNLMGLGWGDTPLQALISAKHSYDNAAFASSRHRAPLTLKDLGL